MKLFTKEINDKLFKQYPLGNDLNKQVVVAKLFNPYGNGRWFLLNSDPEDSNYLWAIVEMGGNVEIGSVSRNELESIRVTAYKFPLERDLSFRPKNAKEVFDGLLQGKHYARGGMMADGGMSDSMKEVYDRIDKQRMMVRSKVALAIGIDNALEYMDKDYVVSPFKLLEGAVSKGFISVDEIDERLWDASVEEANDIDSDYRGSGQGISSSDMNAFISRMLNSAGIKIGVVNNRYERMKHGGSIADSNKEMLLNQAEEFEHHAEELESAVKKADEIPAWVVAKSQRASTDLSDITHYLDGENEQKREMKEGEEYADGGMLNRELNLKVKDMAQKKGLTPQKLGSNYETTMAQAVVSALGDANFHSEAKKLVMLLEGEDEWNDELYKSVYYNAKDEVDEFGRKVANESQWDGVDIAEAFKYILKMNGSLKLANYIDKAMDKMAMGGYMADGGMSEFGDFYEFSKKYVKKNFGSDFDEGYPMVKYEKKGNKQEIESAIGILKNGKKVYFDDDAVEWKEGDKMGKGGNLQSLNEYLNKLINSLQYSPSKKNREKILKEISEVRLKIKNASSDKMAMGGYMADGGEVFTYEDEIREFYDKTKKQWVREPLTIRKGQLVIYNHSDGGDVEAKFLGKSGNKAKIEILHPYKPWTRRIEAVGYVNTWGKTQKDNIKDEVRRGTKKTVSIDKIETDIELYWKFHVKPISRYLKSTEFKEAFSYLDGEKMAMGGETFDSKVKSIKSRLLENKKVSPSVQKDYGKTYSPKEAEESAKRIVGSLTAKERIKMRMDKKKSK